MNNFVAILMSGKTEKWFDTREDAWKYIYSRSCEACKNSDLDVCSTEWSVWSEKEYKELINKND